MNRFLAILVALRPWLAPIAVGIGVLLLVRACNAERTAKGEAERLLEAEKLRAAGLIVEERKGAAALAAEAARLTAENADLAAALAKAKGRVRVVEVVKTVAGPVTVAPSTPAVPCTEATRCVLRQGDAVQFEVEQVRLDTEAGNRLVVGTAGAWRLPERTLLARGAFQAPAPVASTITPDAPARWGAGVVGIVGTDGWAAGPLLALPPLHLWSLQFEASLGAAVGSAGAHGIGTGVIRW